MTTRCPDGETGRRKGLKIPRPFGCAGSNPAPGTTTTISKMRDFTTERRYGQAVRHEPAKLRSPVQIRVSPPIFTMHFLVGRWQSG